MSDFTHDSFHHLFSERILNTPRSFIREMLTVTQNSDIISFAGGLPEPSLFPVEEIALAAQTALSEEGSRALQYSTTEGYTALRQWIVDDYERRGMHTRVDEIIITAGSQQALDLIAKAFIDPGTTVLFERPAYLGALQAFALSAPEIRETTLQPDGPELSSLERGVKGARLFYCVPEFQNPSGVYYSMQKRRAIVEILRREQTLLVEDEPYRELYYNDREALPALAALYDGPSISLGSFSKIVAPGMRLGWIRADRRLIDKLLVAKQATDLHTSSFNQIVLYNYLSGRSLNDRLAELRRCYRERRDAMSDALRTFLPQAEFTDPQGGMFHWVRLPGIDTAGIFRDVLEAGVAYVPGTSFYAHNPDTETMRLNFTNSAPDVIVDGVRRLSTAVSGMLPASPRKKSEVLASSTQAGRASL